MGLLAVPHEKRCAVQSKKAQLCDSGILGKCSPFPNQVHEVLRGQQTSKETVKIYAFAL